MKPIVHCVPKKVTPRHRIIKMSNLSELIYSFIHLISNKLLMQLSNFIEKYLFLSKVINC